MVNKNRISRRDFLKISAAGLAALSMQGIGIASGYLPDFPTEPRLGRVFNIVDIKSKPDPESTSISTVYNDGILVLNKEVIGTPYNSYWKKRLWYETPDGYIPAMAVQPVKNLPNVPLDVLPVYGEFPGMWVEVTVPYVDLYLVGNEPKSPRLIETLNPRFYYSQVLWVDEIKSSENGEVLYHVLEKYGSYGDTFWADARAFKIITPEDVSPISPEIENKYALVNINQQTMSLFENDKEILFTRVATGAKFDNLGNKVDNWSTPIGDNHVVNRKYISLHMAGGTSKASGYEESAVSWSSIFATGGVAIHSTYWHNNYGELLSRGCVNSEPDVAKFFYRWSLPVTPYYEGSLEVLGYEGTKVKVIEG